MPRRRLDASTDARPTRDVILDAAERRFAAQGFAGVSVREIATDAGLRNQASLYHHFKNKRSLYEAVLIRGIEPAIAIVMERAAMTNTAEPGTPFGRFVEDVFVDRILDYLAQHPLLPRLIQRAGIDDPRYLRGTISRLLMPLWTQSQAILEVSEGRWEAADLPHLGGALYLLIFGYFANAELFEILLPDGPLTPAAVERQRRFVRRAVLQLLGAGPEGAAKPRRRAAH